MKIAIWTGVLVTTATFPASITAALNLTLLPTPGNVRKAFDILYLSTIPTLAIQGVVDLILEIYIFILPLPVVLRLKMPRARRLQLAGVFGTALIAVASSAISLAYRIKSLPALEPSGPTSSSYVWNRAVVYITV